MAGTFERFYNKFGNPTDYERAKLLCDEADQLIDELQVQSETFRYSEIEWKTNRLVMISRVLAKQYFPDPLKKSASNAH